MTDIRGAVTIVTGASRGIGVPIARALGERGAKLVLAARSEAELFAVRDELAAAGHTVAAIRCDVADPDDRRRLIGFAEEQFGPVDILINNAGIEVTGALATADPDDLNRIIDINLQAPIQLTRAVLPGMLDRGRGHIVNISSAAGKSGAAYLSPYCASKFGLVGFSHAVRGELRGSGVSCSVICPAFVTDTGMYHRWEEQGVRSPKLAGIAPLGKVVQAVVRAIDKDKAEIIVNRPPLKPLILLLTAAPGLGPRVFEMFGYTKVLRRAAELNQDQ